MPPEMMSQDKARCFGGITRCFRARLRVDSRPITKPKAGFVEEVQLFADDTIIYLTVNEKLTVCNRSRSIPAGENGRR